MNGVNPVVIERCTQLPPNFPVTSDMVKGQLSRGVSLEEEMKVGLFYCNSEGFSNKWSAQVCHMIVVQYCALCHVEAF